VICVGASTSDDTYADYSNRGREVTVCAPSNGSWPILAARAFWDEGIPGEVGASKWYYGDGVDRGSRYQHFGGTSSATPLVAGICALILSANPNLTAREVKQILCQTADKIGSPSEYVNGQSVKYGFGRVNAARAVQEALNRGGRFTPSSTPSTPVSTPATSTPSSTSTSLPSSPPAGNGLFKFMSSARVTNKGFSVQTGSFNQWVNVRSISATLETKFKNPVLTHIVGSGTTTTIYRVLVGQFTTLADANKLLGVMKANGVAGFVKDLSTLM
jgi:subtilisin family serine protease